MRKFTVVNSAGEVVGRFHTQAAAGIKLLTLNGGKILRDGVVVLELAPHALV